MKPYNDLQIIQGIRNKDNNVLQYLYDEYFGMVHALVDRDNGNEEDARDILQEAIIVIYKKIRDESLALTSSFKTYFYAVCKYIWSREMRHRKIEISHLLNYASQEGELIDNLNIDYEKQQRYRLFQEHFNKLGKECRQVLRLFLMSCSLRHIASKMGYKSEKYAKKRKYVCKERLVKSIKSDKRYKQLL